MLARYHATTLEWHYFWLHSLVLMVIIAVVFVSPTSAAMRFQDRSLYMASAVPSETTTYKIGFRYMSPQAVGSVDVLFCVDPIPYHACVPPPGIDVSQAVLSSQTGETGFSILSQDQNHIILSRAPAMATLTNKSEYVFDGIVNPSDTNQSFSIRLRSHTSMDASGPQVDFGSIKGQVTNSIVIETQVPPMLIFCLAEEVSENCVSTNESYYRDMGNLDHNTTLMAQSQMAVGTNASGGFVITANGNHLSAGTSVIRSLTEPTESMAGTNQFGINLVENDEPYVGHDPEGTWANALPAPDYSIPNHYKFVSGDVVAYSPNVSLMKKFTVSYVVNSSQSLRAGVYSTTISFIASGRF